MIFLIFVVFCYFWFMIVSDYLNFFVMVLFVIVEVLQEIMSVYIRSFWLYYKKDGSFVMEVDIVFNCVFQCWFEMIWILIIFEELVFEFYEEWKNWLCCWLVDLLDGIKEFLKYNDEFVVCIVLIEENFFMFGIIVSLVNEEIFLGGKDVLVVKVGFNVIFEIDKWEFIEVRKMVN